MNVFPVTTLKAALFGATLLSSAIVFAQAPEFAGIDTTRRVVKPEQIVSFTTRNPYVVTGAKFLSDVTLRESDLGCQSTGINDCSVSYLRGVSISATTSNVINDISAPTRKFIYSLSQDSGGGISYYTDYAVTGINYYTKKVIDGITYNEDKTTLNLNHVRQYFIDASNKTFAQNMVFPGPTINGAPISVNFVADRNNFSAGVTAKAATGKARSRTFDESVEIAARMFCDKNNFHDVYSATTVSVDASDFPVPARLIMSEIYDDSGRVINPGFGSVSATKTQQDVATTSGAGKSSYTVFESIRCLANPPVDDDAPSNIPAVTLTGSGGDTAGNARWIWAVLRNASVNDLKNTLVNLYVGNTGSDVAPIGQINFNSISNITDLGGGTTTFAVIIPGSLNAFLDAGNLKFQLANGNQGTISPIYSAYSPDPSRLRIFTATAPKTENTQIAGVLSGLQYTQEFQNNVSNSRRQDAEAQTRAAGLRGPR